MKQEQKLSIIVELTKLLRQCGTDLLDIFSQVNSIAADITGSQRSSLYFSDSSGEKLITKVAQGIKQTIEISFGEGIAGSSALQKKSIIENCVKKNPSFSRKFDEKTGFMTDKTIAVPILSKNKKVLGVIQVLNKMEGDYTDDDKDLLILISELVVSVIENQNLKLTLQEEVDKKTKELQELNVKLSQEVKLQVEANRKKDAVMFHQSKLAAMGEMIDAVAHQWKQPLSVISLYMAEIEMIVDETPASAELVSTAIKVNEQINYLIETLGDFRSFFRTDQKIKKFSLARSLHSVLHLLQNEIDIYHLNIIIDIPDTIFLKGIETEFKHVMINLINNAKDAFEENGTHRPDIIIRAVEEPLSYTITVSDNAGGIPDAIVDHIFEANVTSKSEEKGSGIGLYMSKMIIEKMRGQIGVAMIDGGSMFIIDLPKS